MMSILSSEEDARAFTAARCDRNAIERLERFSKLLRAENSRQNLVAAATLESVWVRHFADSAQLLDHVSRETGRWLDLGSGAGFPGLVIAVMRPHFEMVLVESRGLRIQWLERVIRDLGLTKCRVLGTDVRHAETLVADVISARAFAPLPRLVQLSARFSTKATEWVLPKGRSATQDILRLPKLLQARFHVEQSVTDRDSGIVVGRGRMDAKA